MTDPKHSIYIAGPMRGHPEYNFPAFHTAEAYLKMLGWKQIYNPARLDEQTQNFNPNGLTGNENLQQLGFNLDAAIKRDTHIIKHKTAHILMLPGYQRSEGAQRELKLAQSLGHYIHYAEPRPFITRTKATSPNHQTQAYQYDNQHSTFHSTSQTNDQP